MADIWGFFRTRRWSTSLILFFGLFVLGVLLGRASLQNYWFNDDLFIVRVFSQDELADALSGTWEPSGTTTPGYRPLTTLFNHATVLALGEQVHMHRLLRIAIFAAALTALIHVAGRLGTPLWQGALAALIILCTRNTWWVLVWNTDGIRAVNGLLAFVSVCLLLRDLQRPRAVLLCAGAALYVLALLVREESIVFVAVLPLLGLLTRVQTIQPAPPLRAWTGIALRDRRLLLQVVLLLALTAAYWTLRTIFLPQSGLSVSLLGWLISALWVAFPRLAAPSIPAWIGLLIGLWLGLMVLLRTLTADERRRALLWLLCACVSAATGLVAMRANTLLIPICFFSLFLATVLSAGLRGTRWTAALSGVMIIVLLAGSAAQHMIAQRSIAPNSTEYLLETSRYLWGPWVPAYRFIPEIRRREIHRQFEELGIDSEQLYNSNLPGLVTEGRVYAPAENWLSGW